MRAPLIVLVFLLTLKYNIKYKLLFVQAQPQFILLTLTSYYTMRREKTQLILAKKKKTLDNHISDSCKATKRLQAR